ncbi:MAG: cell wall surface anchor family protein, partial [Myxococcales bacterium]|nr:cell wall surface anchor family protein [Myxococcales bacterium]
GAPEADAGDAKLDASVEAPPDAPREVAPEAPPACVPKTEDCFNGLDDDCDGKPDCADPDCTPTAICVPRPAGSVGTTVDGAGACPAGFTTGTALTGGLVAGNSCASSCQCGAGQTSCSADLYTQLTLATCGQNTGGKLVYTMSTADPMACPIPDQNTSNVYGARLTPWNVATTGCAPSGTPTKPTPTWGKALKFCAADKVDTAVGNGCATGSVCMPKGAPGRSCVMLDAVGTCPAGTNADALYTGFTDGRTCAACSCSSSGASCNNVTVQMGSDYSCGVDYADLHGGQATCASQANGVYVPGYKIAGAPTPPTCTPASAATGALTPTGGRTVCCLP